VARGRIGPHRPGRASHDPDHGFVVIIQHKRLVGASLALLLGQAGCSHVQLSPLQRSNPGRQWWKRYPPIDSTVIEGLGNKAELQALTRRARGCGVNVIADVVFNHLANLTGGDEREDLSAFPGLSAADFHTPPWDPGRRPCADSGGNDSAQRRHPLGQLAAGRPAARTPPGPLSAAPAL
jgi:hypothetical protein